MRSETIDDRRSRPDRSPTTIIVNNRVIGTVAVRTTSTANNAVKMRANARSLVWIVRVTHPWRMRALDEDRRREITINLNRVNAMACAVYEQILLTVLSRIKAFVGGGNASNQAKTQAPTQTKSANGNASSGSGAAGKFEQKPQAQRTTENNHKASTSASVTNNHQHTNHHNYNGNNRDRDNPKSRRNGNSNNGVNANKAANKPNHDNNSTTNVATGGTVVATVNNVDSNHLESKEIAIKESS